MRISNRLDVALDQIRDVRINDTLHTTDEEGHARAFVRFGAALVSGDAVADPLVDHAGSCIVAVRLADGLNGQRDGDHLLALLGREHVIGVKVSSLQLLLQAANLEAKLAGLHLLLPEQSHDASELVGGAGFAGLVVATPLTRNSRSFVVGGKAPPRRQERPQQALRLVVQPRQAP